MSAAVSRVVELLHREAAGGRVRVQGWVKTARHGKGVSFLEIGDGSCMAGIQVVAEPGLMEAARSPSARYGGSGLMEAARSPSARYGGSGLMEAARSPSARYGESGLANGESEVRALKTGCAVDVTGELVESPAQGQRFEIRADAIAVVGGIGDDYPLQKKRASFEFLRTIGHLRLRTNTLGAVARVRHAASRAIRRFFDEQGFLELHTPIITASDAEGAGAMFRVTTLDPAAAPRTPAGTTDWAQDFFARPTFLTVSGQLEAEIGALALSKVYTFGPTFRAEDSNTSRHLAEFWMIEPEVAFTDLDGNAALAEQFLRSVLRELLERCGEDLRFFDDRIEKGVVATLEHVVDTPFERMTYTDAIARLEKSGKAFEFPVAWGADLQSEHERWLTEEHVRRPTIVTNYPRGVKAFYMYLDDDEKTVRAMDVLVPRVGEIVGGSQREHRMPVLERRMREVGLDPAHYAWYLDLRRHGGVPHAGFGLGLERLLLFATGMANIRDVIPFPRTPGSAEL